MTLTAPSMTEQPSPSDDETARDQSFLEAARRAKLARIIELGHDPWGTRCDRSEEHTSVLQTPCNL